MAKQEKEHGFNFRYVCYARAHGKTAEEMTKHDELAYPGGCMTGFLIWNSQQLAEWRHKVDYRANALTDQAHAEYDAWLAEKVGMTANEADIVKAVGKGELTPEGANELLAHVRLQQHRTRFQKALARADSGQSP